jgi:mono/diheme cytochrome c family protein
MSIAVLLTLGIVAAAGLVPLWQFYRTALEADPDNPSQVTLGQLVYASHCAACHGANLGGEPDLQTSRENGLPPPPLNASGHTWHHPDDQLFMIMKSGIHGAALEKHPIHKSAFGEMLTAEQIWGVLAYVKSSWPERVRDHQKTHARIE